MSIAYFKYIFVSIFIKRDFCTCDKCSRMIYLYILFYVSNIPPFILIIFSKFIHIISMRALTMFKSLVKIPSTNTKFMTIGSLNAYTISTKIF